ncbi:rhamnogalacturonan acetylesterase [Ferruginibacter sp. HRS2-29]|uniref:rhamnogalacturonan acetylesterase n=1 Tax=Ferruginibacter sp. HRS2-29 TaxID=2487334 RepID=UPI0020CF4156|nr:rhamnogalacturonan acetylesterase [Ferruginibacter sp. HRS2-29]MCP9752003.1 rhamnogalacturonan acetylesterase [Ferruginibacter sp. HRS2-29]
MNLLLSKNSLLWMAGLILSVNMLTDKKKIRIFMAGDSTMSIKEPRYYPETGWGMPFAYFFDSSVTVVNKAKNGRSTKTFRSEGIWKSITDELQPDDYVFLQFGHNDESKEKKERYTLPEEFKANLTAYIKETKEKKAIPVLLTPVSRRKFDSTGTAVQTHGVYSDLVRQVAKETGVLFIDADELSRAMYQLFGVENSKLLFLQLKPGEHPNYPEGKEDNTHFNELGARLVAQLVLKEMRAQKMPLVERIVERPVKK